MPDQHSEHEKKKKHSSFNNIHPVGHHSKLLQTHLHILNQYTPSAKVSLKLSIVAFSSTLEKSSILLQYVYYPVVY